MWGKDKWTQKYHATGVATYQCYSIQAFAYQCFNGTQGVKTCKDDEVDDYFKYEWANQKDGTFHNQSSVSNVNCWATASWGPGGTGALVPGCTQSSSLQAWVKEIPNRPFVFHSVFDFNAVMTESESGLFLVWIAQ